jgi:hypothetical protein
MLRKISAVLVLGALVLAFIASQGGGGPLVGIFAPASEPQTLLNANTGEPVTLEAVQRDVDWHHETAKKLRESR